MNKLIIFAFLFMLSASTVLAQSKTDTIEIKKKGLGHVYRKDGKALTPPDITRMLRSDHEAIKILRKGKAANSISYVFSIIGGGIIGWELGNGLTGRPTNTGAICIGVASLAVAFTVPVFTEQTKAKAVRRYNEDLGKTSSLRLKPEYYLSFSRSGIGLVMRF